MSSRATGRRSASSRAIATVALGGSVALGAFVAGRITASAPPPRCDDAALAARPAVPAAEPAKPAPGAVPAERCPPCRSDAAGPTAQTAPPAAGAPKPADRVGGDGAAPAEPSRAERAPALVAQGALRSHVEAHRATLHDACWERLAPGDREPVTLKVVADLDASGRVERWTVLDLEGVPHAGLPECVSGVLERSALDAPPVPGVGAIRAAVVLALP